MLCLYQETDAPSTTPASCFNLPARLNNVRRTAFAMISASLFCASSTIGSAARTSHRLPSEIPQSCLCWGPCRKLSFKSAIKRNTCTPVVFIMCVSLSQGDCRALICLRRLWGRLLEDLYSSGIFRPRPIALHKPDRYADGLKIKTKDSQLVLFSAFVTQITFSILWEKVGRYQNSIKASHSRWTLVFSS